MNPDSEPAAEKKAAASEGPTHRLSVIVPDDLYWQLKEYLVEHRREGYRSARATSCARCSRSICARTARPVGTPSNRRENGNDSIRVQRPGLPRRALYRGSRQEGGLDGCRCRARPHRPATPGRRGPRPPHGLCGFRRGGVRCRGRRRTSGLSGLLARGCEGSRRPARRCRTPTG